MPASSAAGHAAAAPLHFPLVLTDGTGRVFTAFQLPAAHWSLGSPTYRTATKTDISNWTF